MFIVGISGKIGTGKSTVGNLLEEWFKQMDVLVCRVAFGDLLKRETANVYNVPLEDCYTQEGKQKRFSIHDIDKGTAWQEPKRDISKLIKPSWFESETFTVREALQWYGTEVTRAEDPDYWVKAADTAIAMWEHGWTASVGEDKAKIAIIDDVRFPNEKLFIIQNGMCVRLNPYPGYEPYPGHDHPSETLLDNAMFDLVLAPPLGALEEAAAAIMDKLRTYEGILAPLV